MSDRHHRTVMTVAAKTILSPHVLVPAILSVVIVLGVPHAFAVAPGVPPASCPGGIDNFSQVSPGLFRAAQFSPDCAVHLVALGIRTIVDLRKESPATAIERDRARAAGLNYVHVPMSPFARPSRDQVDEILGMVRNPEHRPVLIHCKRGSDRTGVVVAAFRVRDEAWSTQAALEEAKRFGLGWWQLRMKGFIRSLVAEP